MRLGGPASGKGTQCAKLVEEFGYTHISVGDLMRAEKDKGTKDGERIRKIMNEGGLVPFELTVQVLINGLIANPSKNYLIDGFPRAVDQAIYFEQNVCECQNVLYYDVSEEVLLQRCLVRATNAVVQREDDNEETLKKRLRTFQDLSKPVVDLYSKFGKVRYIDAGESIDRVYDKTRMAMLPQIFSIIGPKCSGKTALGSALAERTNMNLLNFSKFIKENGLKQKDCETKTQALIKHLVNETAPRILLEDFPQSIIQAKYFFKNCVVPTQAFYLRCSKDTCQERMLEMGKDHPEYLPSSILSKKIKKFHDSSATLLPYLRDNQILEEVDSEQTYNNAFKQICSYVEPCVIHVRSSSADNELRKNFVETFLEDFKFVNLDVNSLIRDENERKTQIGLEFLNMVAAGKIIPAEMIVRMLRKIIYSGDGRKHFLLSSFPDIIEQAKEFEKSCASITAIIYAAKDESKVEIKNNNLSLFNIDALFQKEFRLKILSEPHTRIVSEIRNQNVQLTFIYGKPLSGKTTIAQIFANKLGCKVVDWATFQEQVKKSMAGEGGEEAEAQEPPADRVQNALFDFILNQKGEGKNNHFVVDGLPHQNEYEIYMAFFNTQLPQNIVIVNCEKETILKRHKKKNEIEGDLPEEQVEEFNNKYAADSDRVDVVAGRFGNYAGEGKTEVHMLSSDVSVETLTSEILEKFAPKVILVNHEKRLTVDTTCANLAIKYKFLYISVYQTIKQHIEGHTNFGKRLLATKKPKDIRLQTQAKDEFLEIDYSAVHFDLELVIELIQHTIKSIRRGQRYILLEGFCNSGKLIFDDDRLELRYMDELFQIEKNIGEVQAIIGLQFNSEKDYIEEYEIQYEEFPEPEPVIAKPKGEGEEEEAEQPPVEEEEKKEPAFKIEDKRWTITDRKPKNLPQLFMQSKGIAARHDVKTAEQYSSSQYEAISKCLDEFCAKVIEANDSTEKYLYQQVIFNE